MEEASLDNNPLESTAEDNDLVTIATEAAATPYHELHKALPLRFPEGASPLQILTLLPVIEDSRVKDCFTFREQCYNHISILHNDDDTSDDISKCKISDSYW